MGSHRTGEDRAMNRLYPHDIAFWFLVASVLMALAVQLSAWLGWTL